MNEGISSKTLWNEAAKGGLILGIVTILLQEANQLIPGFMNPGVLKGFVSVTLWIIKFVGCIYLLRFLMKKFAGEHTEITNRDSRHFGEAIGLLSAVLVAGFAMVNLLYINPDLIEETVDTMMQSYASFLTSDQMEDLDEAMANLPVISFFSTFIYCSLFGVVASSIISTNIPKLKSIFDDEQNNDVEEQ